MATKSLTTKPQISLFSSLSPPQKLGFSHRQFFGYGLRPPGTGRSRIRSRRKCKGKHDAGAVLVNSPPRFLFRASLNSQAVFVALAVVTCSAVYYFSHNRKSKKDVGKRLVHGEGKELAGNIGGENGHVLELNGASKQSQNSSLLHHEAAFTRPSESHKSDDVALSVVTNSAAVKYAEVSKPSQLFEHSESATRGHVTVAMEVDELQLNGHEEKFETMFVSEMPVVEGSAALQSNGLITEVEEHLSDNEHDEEMESTSAFPMYRESMREELYTFFEATQPLRMSSSDLNGLRPFSSSSTILDSKAFSSLVISGVNGAKNSQQNSTQSADPRQNEGIRFKRNGAVKDWGIPKGKQGSHLKTTKSTSLGEISQPNGKLVHYKHQPSEKSNVYNVFLKAGRLSDCIKILQDLETKGLLDMNKIYHTRFFETSKRCKAVKEAFQFTMLIPNPTLSTFNMLMSVCASSQDSEGAFRVMQLVKEAGFKADCKLYTTLISTCAKSGKVDAMFKVYHEMVNAGVEPNIHTYGALIDGCARAGQVAKAFGAYGIMRSKNVEPDRVIFNALITACGLSDAVDRAFDVLAEMRAETKPIDPDHVTIGALMKACADSGQVDRAREVYTMMHEFNIKGTPEVYTIAVNSCSQTGDWEFACSVHADMKKKGVAPDEMFLSALIDVAGHAGKLDAAFEILLESRKQGIRPGIILYSSLMGACCNAKQWQKALELYKDIKSINLKPTVSTLNALITALCEGDQLQKAMDVLSELSGLGLRPNSITYSVLLTASERKDDLEAALQLLSQAKQDGIPPSLTMCRCIIGMCLRRFEDACTLGEPVLPFDSRHPHLDNKWTSLALTVYRETICGGVIPSVEIVSQLLGCLRLPFDSSLKNRLIEHIVLHPDASGQSNLFSLIDGFGEYDPRAFSLLEEAASLGVVPCVSLKENPLVIDAEKLQIHVAEVYLLTVLKGLKHRLAAGARLPNITIVLPPENVQIQSPKGERTIRLSGRTGQAIAALLRRLRLSFLGNGSFGKIRMNGLTLRRWLQPKLDSSYGGDPVKLSSTVSRLGKGISLQQRNIRTGYLSLEEKNHFQQ